MVLLPVIPQTRYFADTKNEGDETNCKMKNKDSKSQEIRNKKEDSSSKKTEDLNDSLSINGVLAWPHV